jgi:hypothetical protein
MNKTKLMTIATLAVALMMTSGQASAQPRIKPTTGTIVGGLAGLVVGGPVGLIAGAYLGNEHDDTRGRLGRVEQSADIAHQRLNEHDGHFNGLRDYLERQDGRATAEVQETRKTRARFPWENEATANAHTGRTTKEWAEMKTPWSK